MPSAMTRADANADAAEVIAALQQQVAELKRQLEWFKRQLFGRKK